MGSHVSALDPEQLVWPSICFFSVDRHTYDSSGPQDGHFTFIGPFIKVLPIIFYDGDSKYNPGWPHYYYIYFPLLFLKEM